MNRGDESLMIRDLLVDVADFPVRSFLTGLCLTGCLAELCLMRRIPQPGAEPLYCTR